MDLGLENKSVLVSGSSGGIGFAIAEAFLKEGARVQISGRDAERLSDAHDSLRRRYAPDRLDAFSGDLTREDAIAAALRQAADRFGGLDGAVANIGSGVGKTGWALSAEDWRSMADVNLVGSMTLAAQAVPYLKGRDNPSLTFVSSIAGLEAIPAPIPYSAAKAALQMAAKNLSRQLGPDRIRVNTVAPGNVQFPGGVWDRKRQEDAAAVERYIAGEVPLGRFAEAEEIADAVVFLASARARFITGALLTVDGGQTR